MAAVRQFTVIALIFFVIVGIALAASDAPAPSADGDAAGGATAGAPAGDGLAGAPAEGPGAAASGASTFKISSVVAIMNVATATLFFF